MRRRRRQRSATTHLRLRGVRAMKQEVGEARSLASIEILCGLPEDVLGRLEDACQWRDYTAGDKLMGRGDLSHDVFFILSGTAHVMNFAASGRIVAFASLERGDYFGELAAIDGLPRSATVVAATPCSVAILPGSEFRRLVASDPDLALTLLKRLAEIIRNCDDRIFNLTSMGAAQRICLELLRLSEPDPGARDAWVIHPVPTQATLASVAGTSRETVARMIRRLSTEGIVERKSRTLYIRDRKRLEDTALQAGVVG